MAIKATSAASDMTVPFVLGLIGGIIIILASLVVGLIVSAMTAMIGMGQIGAIATVWGLIVGIVTIIGSWFMRTPEKAKIGAILTIIFGILGFITPGNGIIIGPILAIIGGALGYSKLK